MSARTASQTASNGQTDQTDQTAARIAALLKEHAELVAQYPVTTGAAKAQVSRKLNVLQLELDLLDADYPYWERPSPVVVRSFVHTPDELVARIAGLRKQMTRADRNEASKSTAARELETALKQAESRGIEVPAA